MKLRVVRTETESSTEYQSKKSSFSRKRLKTEMPLIALKRGSQRPLPTNHDEYIDAQQYIEYSNQRRIRIASKPNQQVKYDIKMAFLIRQRTFSDTKYLHKSSFEMDSPLQRKKAILQPRNSFEWEIKQGPVGQPAKFQPEWESRWSRLFELYFKIEEIRSKAPDEELKMPPGIRTSLEVFEYVKTELQKAPNLRNYFELDKMAYQHRFFQRFPRGVRIGLLEQCKYKYAPVDSLILSHSLNAEFIYIILRGSCKVKSTARTSFGTEIQMVTGSFYEGQHFGLQNLVQELQVKDLVEMNLQEVGNFNAQYIQSQIFAQENTHLLEIGAKLFESVILKSIEQQLNMKIKILQRCKIFRHQTHEQLVPLAAVLQVEEYTYGQTILKQGSIINKLCIVSKGWLQSILPYRKCQNKDEFIPDKHEEPSLAHHEVGDIKITDVFGTSALMNFDEIQATNLHKKDNTAFLSIICSSKEAEIFSLDSSQFDTLPDQLQLQIKAELRLIPEFDDIDVNKVKRNLQNWDSIKQSFYRQEVTHQILRKKLYKR